MAASHDPRADQKQRTRSAIVEAATKLLAEGGEPTVAAAAAAARVSRATAYRYFPTPEALMLEVSGVTPAYAPIGDLIETLPADDVEARLSWFVDTLNDAAFADEPRMRMALKVYLDTWFSNRGDKGDAPAVREGRRMGWLARVLAPARTDQTKAWRRLEAALALTVGGDAMVVMKDVCRLSDKDAKDALRWAALALLRAGLAEMGRK